MSELKFDTVAFALSQLMVHYPEEPLVKSLQEKPALSISALAEPANLLSAMRVLAAMKFDSVLPEDMDNLKLIKQYDQLWGPEIAILLELIYGESITLIARNMDQKFCNSELVPLENILNDYLTEPCSSNLTVFIRDVNYFMRHAKLDSNYLLPTSPALTSRAELDSGFLEIQQGLLLMEESWDELVAWALLHSDIEL